MEKLLCDVCNNPLEAIDGKYVCLYCDIEYDDVEEDTPESKSVQSFLESVSLDKSRRISSRIADSIAIKRFEAMEYVVAALSDGRYYTRFNGGGGYYGKYRGQCAAENWFGVEKIYSNLEFTIGITSDGELQPTLIELDDFFKANHARLKRVVYADHNPCEVMGIDMDGKALWIKRGMNTATMFTKWPPLKQLYRYSSYIIGVSEDGHVLVAYWHGKPGEKKQKVIDTLTKWTDIESIVCTTNYVSGNEEFIGLKSDGSLVYSGGSGSQFKNAVQILPNTFDKAERLFCLLKNGKLCFRSSGNVIASNVAAIFPEGYVDVNGTVFCQTDLLHFEAIPDLKLFGSIVSYEKECECSHRASITYKSDLKEEHQHLQKLLQEETDERASLEAQISKLGFFSKEKKVLRQKLSELEHKLSAHRNEADEILCKISSFPTGKPTWRIIKEDPSAQTEAYSMASIQAMSHNYYDSLGKPKKSSVIGSAAVGGIIAGPTGAIVGAIYAADKNRRNSK